MSYTLSPQGVKFITSEERFEPAAYNKDGHWTIGFGHTGGVTDGDMVTMDEAIKLFRMDLDIPLVKLWCVNRWLNQPQVDALASLLFNVGTGILCQEHSLGKALEEGEIGAIANAILLYDMATINGVHGPFLASRRKAEYEMFNGAKTVTTPSGTFECAAP